MKEEFYFYTPNSAELKEIEKELKKNRLWWLIATLFSNGVIYIALFSTPNPIDFLKAAGLFISPFFVAGIYFIVYTINLFSLSTSNLLYSRGKIIQSWSEMHSDSDGDSYFQYFITIEQPNGVVNERIHVSREMCKNKGAEVVVAYDKKNKIRLVVLKNNDLGDGYIM